MGNSLLAQLYPYFKGSQEDVATASLQYLVSGNEILNIAFTNIIMERLCLEPTGRYQYRCQVSGRSDEKERPDMSGYNEEGNERCSIHLLCYEINECQERRNY